MSSSPRASERPSTSGRRCTRPSCASHATHTLTYIYSDSTAVLGPLSTFAEPHTYDLCAEHSERLKVPQGWTVIKHKPDTHSLEPSPEDVLAIAEAVRQSVKFEIPKKNTQPDVGRRGHLRAIPRQE
ncbi:MAG: DUF3499 domain-containing protein [Actinomycetota bacterium]